MENYYIMWLNDLSGLTIKRKIELLKVFGSGEGVWNATSKDIKSMTNMHEDDIYKFIKTRNIDKVYEYIEKAYKLGAKYITYKSSKYPELLKKIDLPPIGFYVLGELPEDNLPKVAFVGSRRCTEYGSSCCYNISKELAGKNIVIVSGMATGIDSMAHKGAIDAGGKTIAVVGTGIDVCYPSNNRGLMENIIKNGCVISEFPLGTKPNSYNFPQRNRIISGLSQAVAVIEAASRSGTLITANFALDYGRDVFALPGNITSKFSEGTNNLIKEGAFPLTSGKDILEVLNIDDRTVENKDLEKNSKKNIFSLASDEKLVYDCIDLNFVNIEEIITKTGLDIKTTQYILTMLELKGLIRKISGERYTKSV